MDCNVSVRKVYIEQAVQVIDVLVVRAVKITVQGEANCVINLVRVDCIYDYEDH